jgi:hypothetical protein
MDENQNTTKGEEHSSPIAPIVVRADYGTNGHLLLKYRCPDRACLPGTVNRVNAHVSERKQRGGRTLTRNVLVHRLGVLRWPPSAYRSRLLAAALGIALLFAFALARPLPAKPLFGSHRNLTVERIYSAPSLSGELADGIEWEPNSQRISYLDSDDSGDDLVTLDVQTGRRKVLVSSSVLDPALPPMRPSAIQSTGLGRIEPPRYLWSPTGDSVILIGTDKLVLFDLDTMTPKTLVRVTVHRNRRSKVFARWQVG